MADVIGGVLARACNRTGVQLCGFVAASNHLHLLCRARDGSLSRFMQYVLANVSKKAGRLVGWRGQFWERRFSAEPVLDDGAMEGRLKYILAHGVKEGLVREVAQWPGLSCAPQLLQGPVREFPFHEWTRRWEAGKLVAGGEQPWAPEWSTSEHLELHPLPHWASLSREQRAARVRTMIRDIETEGRRRFPRGVLGARAVLLQNPHHVPSQTKRSPRPWFHAAERRLGELFKARYAIFVAAFRRASQLFRAGNWAAAEFPPFAFRPWVPVRV